MFHSVKRHTVGKFATKNEPVNAEFDTLRQSLDNVSKALTASLADIDTAEKSWNGLVKNAAHFSSGLHSLYPRDDDIRSLFKTTLDGVEGPLSKELASAGEPTSKVKGIERMVRAYLMEIKTLTAEYGKVEDARRDFAMYQNKADKIGKKSPESDKQSKNLDKLESSKATYTSILEGTVHRMKSSYEKAPVMFRASYVAYWLYQSHASGIAGGHLKSAFEYASANADGLFSMSQSAAHGSTTPNAT